MKRVLIMLAAVLAASGCVDQTTTVILNHDGSGSIVETSYLTGTALGMMKLVEEEGEGPDDQTHPLMDEQAARDKAGAFGTGVAFRSVQESTNANERIGATALYTFKDIAQVKIPLGLPDARSGHLPAANASTADHKADQASVTFSYTPGHLIIRMPRPDDASQLLAFQASPGFAEEEKPQAMRALLPMFKGMRHRLLVKLPSEIKDTNATYAEADASTGKRQVVTLLDIDLDMFLALPDGLGKLEAIMNQSNLLAQIELLQEVKGIKVQGSPQIDVTF